jgi:hypothetical protein
MVAIAFFSSLSGDQEPTAIARVILGDPKGGYGDTPLPERPSLGIASKPDEGQTLSKLFPKPLTDRCAGMRAQAREVVHSDRKNIRAQRGGCAEKESPAERGLIGPHKSS